MDKKIRILRKPRRFSEEFKRNIVKEYETGNLSVRQLGKLYGINYQSIYSWIYRYSTLNEKGVRIVEMQDSSDQKLKDLERKVKELERLVGQKQIKIEYLQKMIELTEEDLGIDIKKNADTPQSDGLGKTKKK